MPFYEEKPTYEPIQETKTPQKKREVSCRDYALNLLNRQAHSSGHLRRKLERKGYTKDQVKETIAELTELGLLKDQEYAQTYFDNLKRYRGFGYYGIKKKLMDKSIETAYINTILQGLSIKEETEIAERVLAKARSSEYNKLASMLKSRGFRGEAMQRAISKKTRKIQD